jgi:uridine kinase
MIALPEMVMIGGNSRNSGKTTLACSIIKKLSATHEVIGLKVTSIRAGEDSKHGNHDQELFSDYTIFEELDSKADKDTSKMLRAGAKHVYYIRVADNFIEKAVLHFLSKYINKQVIVCESRSLRNIVIPGLFLMMIRTPAQNEEKDVGAYLLKADELFYFDSDVTEMNKFAAKIHFANGKFISTLK